MTGEELDRAIECLLQSQASSEARLSRLEGAVGQLAATQSRSNDHIDQLQHGFVRFQDGMDELCQQVSRVMKVAEIALETSLRNSSDIDALTKLVGGIIESRNGDTGRDR